MKKGVLVAIIVGIVAIILLVSIKVFSGYALWSTNQVVGNPLSTCEETDAGKDYTNAGITKWNFRGKIYEFEDFCSFGITRYLTEYYCTPRRTAAPQSFDCGKLGLTCKSGENGAYCG